MKTNFTVSVLIIIATISFYALQTVQTTQGPHGGSLQKVKNYHVEMKALNTNVYTYLFDEKLKAISNKDISCTIQFFFNDSVATDARMKPIGDDGFVLESNAIAYRYCKIVFKMPANTISTRFENENIIVNINK